MRTEVIVVWSYLMMIAATVIAHAVIEAAMTTMISVIASGTAEVEMRMVGVDAVDAQAPGIGKSVDWTIEILQSTEASELASIKDHTEIVVTPIQQIVVSIDGILIAIDHIIHDFVDSRNKIVIDLIAIFVLHSAHGQFISHSVAEETRILTNLTVAHGEGSSYCCKYESKGCKKLLHTVCYL